MAQRSAGGLEVRPVTYLMSHFPAVAHTFLLDEIANVEEHGVPILAISINSPREIDLLDDVARRWHQRTTYVKSTPIWRIATLVLRDVVRAPSVLAIPFRGLSSDLVGFLRRWFYLVEACIVADAMMKAGSRHVHAHFGGPVSMVAWYAAQVGGKVERRGSWRWSLTIHGWSEFVAEDRNRLREKVASAAFTACVSSFTKAQLMRISKPSVWDRIHVARCGIDLDRFERRPDPVDPGRRVLIVGRLSPEKGHAVLAQAVAAAAELGVSIEVDVVGPDQGIQAELIGLLERLGVRDQFNFHGPRPPGEVVEFLRRADVLCLPTFAEGLPIVLMEAMASGVPVVTTYVAGIPELAIGERTALVVPAGDVEQLTQALVRVLTDSDLRRSLTDAARDLVTRQHDIRETSRRIAELLVEVTGDDGT